MISELYSVNDRSAHGSRAYLKNSTRLPLLKGFYTRLRWTQVVPKPFFQCLEGNNVIIPDLPALDASTYLSVQSEPTFDHKSSQLSIKDKHEYKWYFWNFEKYCFLIPRRMAVDLGGLDIQQPLSAVSSLFFLYLLQYLKISVVRSVKA